MLFLPKSSAWHSKVTSTLLYAAVILYLCACGQTGELTLPDDPKPEQKEQQE
ncbi:lipopeptide [Agarilytica rhodophyticola]|uniref:lipopeptide n=1 Tax=Agarilytica rhodophyticola TaxID=1737490 RepID=UPI000CD95D19|nr:lipopeptide [Agarilytica rhodophyticola]